MCSDSEKNMSAFADQNHAPSLTCVRLEFLISVFLLFCIEFSVFLIAKYLCIAFLLKHFYNDARIQNQLQKCRRPSYFAYIT